MTVDEINKKIEGFIKTVKDRSLKRIEIEALSSIRKNFEAGGRPRWQPSIKKGKAKGTKTLVISGNLSNVGSNVDYSGSQVVLTSNPAARAYARIQQEGGTINRKGGSQARRTKRDGRSVFASKKRDTGKANKVDVSFSKPYQIKIPARPYLVIPPEDYERILKAVATEIKSI
jgi:phage gpG-like protein